MRAKIALITIITGDPLRMKQFYRDVLGFRVADDRGRYVEFENEGVRFAVCHRSVMSEITGSETYDEPPQGQRLELAFPLDTPDAVDRTYAELVAKGATPVKGPADMPWGQRAAFIADPDGNIHELFAELPAAKEQR